MQELHLLGPVGRLALGQATFEGAEHRRGGQLLQNATIACGVRLDDLLIGVLRPGEESLRIEARVARLQGADSRQVQGRRVGGRPGGGAGRLVETRPLGALLRLTAHASAEHGIELEQDHGGEGGGQ